MMNYTMMGPDHSRLMSHFPYFTGGSIFSSIFVGVGCLCNRPLYWWRNTLFTCVLFYGVSNPSSLGWVNYGSLWLDVVFWWEGPAAIGEMWGARLSTASFDIHILHFGFLLCPFKNNTARLKNNECISAPFLPLPSFVCIVENKSPFYLVCYPFWWK